MKTLTFLSLLFVSGCVGPTDSGDLDSANSDSADSDSAGEPYNPPNPDGLGPAPVPMGSASDLTASGAYVLLAKAAISNTTGSAITGGALGLSPAAGSYYTGFSEGMDPSNVYSTSPAVPAPGKLYAADYADPTPANLTSAILSMEAAYADAASRTNADYLNLGSGAVGGLSLEPGLYTWGSSVTVPDDLTLTGSAEDVWIFQIEGELAVATGKRVILAGGADAANVFWQVSGEVTVGTGAHFEGIILSKTGITLQTNASLHGRAHAQTMIALDDNAVVAP